MAKELNGHDDGVTAIIDDEKMIEGLNRVYPMTQGRSTHYGSRGDQTYA
jgi:hypothetical protein